MRLFAIGVSHRTAPLDVRERVDFGRAGFQAALAALAARNIAREMVVVSTCNRAEIYAAADTEAAVEAVARFFSDYHQVSPEDLRAHLYVHRGADVARHLFRVTAGLDSLVVGEPQIMGQVKNAYTAASEEHYTGTRAQPPVPYRFHRGQAGAHARPASAKAQSRSATRRSRWQRRSFAT